MLAPLPNDMEPGTVVAHRGNRVAERENTVEAFRAARRSGAAAVELDVRRTRDGVLVVHHDATVEGVGTIVELDAAELGAAAPWLPTLHAALDACAGMWVNVEIKNWSREPDWDQERTTASLLDVDRRGIIVSSFDWESAGAARDAGFVTALLAGDSALDAVRQAAAGGHRAVNVRATLLEGGAASEVVAAALAAGLWVMAWTVNDPDEAIRLRACGVHAIMTDDPGTIATALAPRS